MIKKIFNALTSTRLIKKAVFEMGYSVFGGKRMPWEYDALDPDLERALHDLPPGKFLDVGCGIGSQTIALYEQGFDVIGSDFSKKAIAYAKKRSPHLDFVVDDILDSQLPHGHFDYIFDRGVLHGMKAQQQPRVVQTYHTLLKPDGYLFLKCFSAEESREWLGPMRMSEYQIHALFSTYFNIESIAHTEYQGNVSKNPRALFAKLRK